MSKKQRFYLAMGIQFGIAASVNASTGHQVLSNITAALSFVSLGFFWIQD